MNMLNNNLLIKNERLNEEITSYFLYQIIKGKTICDDLVYINPQNGYKITRYIENVRCCNPFNYSDLMICMRKLRDFHSLNLKVNHIFDIFERRKDFPLFEFPIIPIINASSFLLN